jgi:hypothetical protein
LPGVVTLGGDDPAPRARELVRALRHPGVSVIVDLSRMPHHLRSDYLRSVLPLLNTLRRTTGFPHKILLDEAHYCLGAGNAALFDRQLGGYILVTYRVSALDAAIRATEDAVVMVTRETDAYEVDALLDMCRPGPGPDNSTDPDVFGALSTNEAALLPGPEESQGQVRRFQMAPRLTSHVRHRSKYLDMPVLEDHAFVFRAGGRHSARARTLREFMSMLNTLPSTEIGEYLQRQDFSRWIDNVFSDHGLGSRIRTLEADYDTRDARDISADVAQSIRARYETAELVTP